MTPAASRFFSIALCLGSSSPLALAQLPPREEPAKPATPSSPLSPEEMAKIREQVSKLEKEVGQKRSGLHVTQLAELKAAMTGNDKAFNYWEGCKKQVEFDDMGKTATDFAEWRKREGKTLSANNAFCASLRLQIQFLALAIMQSHAETPAAHMEVCTSAMAYAEDLAESCGKEENLAKKVLGSIMDTGAEPDEVVTVSNLEERLKQVREASAALGGNILDSIFAKKLKLDGSVDKKPNMALNPGNIDEIYDRLVIAPYREKKDAAGIASAWAKRIAQTGRIAKGTKVRELEEKFEKEKVPSMKWAMYKDQWTAGQQKTAVQSMIALISANPAHQDCSNWLIDLKGLTEEKTTP